MKTPVLILFGPTASGKTDLLMRLFGHGGSMRAEIISADSMQVYRGMDIGTAKPNAKERESLIHHLIDIRNPDEQFSAGEFVRLATEACLAAAGRGALPVVSGGTGFYLKNLVLGLSEAPPSNQRIRTELKHELSEKGAASLMEELSKADPVSAEKIHINDEYRLLRALEVYRLSGRPLSSFASPWSASGGEMSNDVNAKPHESPFRFLLIGLRRKKDELYNRINARCAEMFRLGLAEEVKSLFKAGYSPEDPGLRAIGYREFFVDAERLSEDLAGVEALVAQNSRRYAKRQITFFASIPFVNWVDMDKSIEDVITEIRKSLQGFLLE
jgi:tRNA dimethylallyltransferase